MASDRMKLGNRSDSNAFDTDRCCRLYIGCAGWNVSREMQSEFPEGGSHLHRYSRRLSAVEINSSFYRAHLPKTYRRWAEEVPSDFRFSLKVPKQITHDRRLKNCEALIEAFWEQARNLGDRLGAFLIQLPPSLSFESTVARKFFEEWRSVTRAPIVCEPRHPSWFSSTADSTLEEFEIGRVAADPAPVPAAAEPGGTSNVRYFRLHGSPKIYYSNYE